MTPSLKSIETLKSINSIAVDDEIPILHHYMFWYNNKRYSYDRDYLDHDDGSITGYVVCLNRNNYITSKETFKIESDGNILQKGVFRNFALSKKVIKDVEKGDNKKRHS